MYSRFSGQQNAPEKAIQIPEHYSGCAFSPGVKPQDTPPVPASRPSQPSFLEIAKPTPPKERPDPDGFSTAPPEDTAGEIDALNHSSAKAPSYRASPFSGLLGGLGHAFPFSHGLGFEELLLLGLIILLSRNENESDVILLLGLLLFCG